MRGGVIGMFFYYAIVIEGFFDREFMMNIKTILCFFAFMGFALGASAWDGRTVGKIRSVDVTGGNNYDYRITLVNSPALCGNSNSWAYINESDSNYQVYVSLLTAAYMANKQVTIYATVTAIGYCHIGYIVVAD